MRGRLSGEASYTAPVPLGGVVGGATVGRVIASRDDACRWANGWPAPSAGRSWASPPAGGAYAACFP